MSNSVFSLEDFFKQASNLLPGDEFRREANKNIQALMQSSLSKMDVVPRAEFDAQVAKLHACEEQLLALQAQIETLEAQLNS